MEITMKYILDKFDNCNVFSLSSSLPIKSIPTADKEELLKQNLNNEKEFLLDRYEYFTQKEKVNIDFETLFNDIVRECEEFYSKLGNESITKLCGKGSSPFICDHVGNDTKYSKPLGLIWHFYHNIQHVLMSNESLSTIPETKDFQADLIFTDKDATLKNNFIKYEYTFCSHCTKGPLQLVLYFNLNNETKNWLLQFEDDFALADSNFEDLAIYNDDKLEFSSCTHEEFNSLSSNAF